MISDRSQFKNLPPIFQIYPPINAESRPALTPVGFRCSSFHASVPVIRLRAALSALRTLRAFRILRSLLLGRLRHVIGCGMPC